MNRAQCEQIIARVEASGRPSIAATAPRREGLNRYSARRRIDALEPGGRNAPLYPSRGYGDAMRAYLARAFGSPT